MECHRSQFDDISRVSARCRCEQNGSRSAEENLRCLARRGFDILARTKGVVYVLRCVWREMKADYDLGLLDPGSFEHLVNALALPVLGSGATGFAPGPDGGRDGVFRGRALYPS